MRSKNVSLTNLHFKRIGYHKFGESANVIEITSDLTERVVIDNIVYEDSPVNFMLIGGLTPELVDDKYISIKNLYVSGLVFDRYGYIFSTNSYSSLETEVTITLSESIFENISF